MLTQEELQKRIACAALLPKPGPEVLKEVCRSRLEALALLEEAARPQNGEHIISNYTNATTNTYLPTGSARNPHDKIAELEQHLRGLSLNWPACKPLWTNMQDRHLEKRNTYTPWND